MERLRELGCSFDPDRRKLDGPRGPVRLAAHEAELLAALYRAEGAPLSRGHLREACALPSERAVDFAVRRLRAKIERDPTDPRVILTVPGRGYRLGLCASSPPALPPRELLRVGERELDLELGIVHYLGQEQTLTALQRGVLRELVEAGGDVVERRTLFARVWGRNDRSGVRAVDAVVCQLRALLEPNPAQPVHLRTVRGEGYRWLSAPAKTNAPRARRALIGRGGLLETLQQALASSRWVLLTGPPGVGKSRLAQELCWILDDPLLPGGAWWVDAALLRSSEELTRAVLDVLGMAARAEVSVRSLAASLQRRPPLLLVLDNLEQVRDAHAFVSALLIAAPTVRLLGISTVALDVPGGRTLPVPGLRVPEARALYLAAANEAGVSLPEAEQRAVDALVRSLDGLPLALELAGLRAATLPPSRWLALGSQRLGQRSSGAARGRHSSLISALERSWSASSLEERRALACCRVFRDPFTLDAAATVAGVDERVLHGLARSAWLSAGEAFGVKAFRLYEVVKQWLGDRPLDEASLDAHARWFGERARVLLGGLRTIAHDQVRREVFRTQRDLLAAAERLISLDPELAAQIALLFGQSRWFPQHALSLSERLVALSAPPPSSARLWAYRAALATDGQSAEHAEQMALALGLPEDDWSLRSSRACRHRRAWLPFDLGPCPPGTLEQIDWLTFNAEEKIRRGEAHEALGLLRRAESLARRQGDVPGLLILRSFELCALEALGAPWRRLADGYEALSRDNLAEGWLGEASRSAGLAAFYCACEGRRARLLVERARMLAIECGDAQLENRAAWLWVCIDLGQADPWSLIERLLSVRASALAQRDQDTADRCLPLLALSWARAGDDARALAVCDSALSEPHPRVLDMLSAIASLLEPRRPLPVPSAPGSQGALALQLVGHHLRGGPLPSPVARSLTTDVFLQALDALARARTAALALQAPPTARGRASAPPSSEVSR